MARERQMQTAEKRAAPDLQTVRGLKGTVTVAESEQDSREPNAAGMAPDSSGAFAASDLPDAEPLQERRAFYGSTSTVHRGASPPRPCPFGLADICEVR